MLFFGMRGWKLYLPIALLVSSVISTWRNSLCHGYNDLARREKRINSVAASDSGDEHGQIVTTVVNTADGFLHGLDEDMNLIWSSSTGGAMISGSNRFSDHHQHHDPHKRDDVTAAMESSFDSNSEDYTVVPTTDGSLLYHTQDGMRKTSVTARFLAENSPFVSQSGVVFTGSKKTSVMGLDLASGKVLHDFSGGSFDRRLKFTRNCPDGSSGLCSTNLDQQKPIYPFWVGRVDYLLRAIDGTTGNERFNVTYSEVHPMNFGLASSPASSASYFESQSALPNGHVKGFLTDAAQAGDERPPKSRVGLHGDVHEPESFALVQRSSHPLSQSDKSNHANDVSIVSTPEGDLYFADSLSGKLDPVPISLKSPVIKAFKLSAKKLPESSYHVGAHASQYSIKNMQVHHRIVTYPSFVENQGNTALHSEGKVVIVQSVRSETDDVQNAGRSSSSYYALEATPLELPDMEQQYDSSSASAYAVTEVTTPSILPPSKAQRLSNEDEVDIGGEDHPSLREGKMRQDKSDGEQVKVVKTAKNPNSLSVLKKMISTPVVHPLRQKSHRTPAKQSQHLKLTNSAAANIFEDEAPANTFESCADYYRGLGAAGFGRVDYVDLFLSLNNISHQDIDVCACNHWFIPPAKKKIPKPAAVDADLLTLLSEESESSSSAAVVERITTNAGDSMRLRGQHVLRPEVYDGDLFSPKLFTGVLGSENIDTRHGADAWRGSDKAGQTFPPQSTSARVKTSLWTRTVALIETFTATAIALFVCLVAIAFMAVLVIRVFGIFPDFLPSHSFAGQIVYLCRSVLYWGLMKVFLDSKNAGVAELMQLVNPNPRVENESRDELQSNLDSRVVESLGDDGKRYLQIGALCVHVEEILGYGSQGTVVYRGSLNGRPVAVKRILSQFAKSAERYCMQ